MPALVLAGSLIQTAPAHSAAPSQLPEGAAHRWQSGAASADRLQHATLSLTLGLAIGLATRRPAAAAAGPIALGIAKEIWDRPRTGFDTRDLAADAAGAGLAAVLTHALAR